MIERNPFRELIESLEKMDSLNFAPHKAIEGSILYANRYEEIKILPPQENRYDYEMLAKIHPRQYEMRMLMLELQKQISEPDSLTLPPEDLIDLAEMTKRESWERNMYLRKAAVGIAIRDRIPHDIRLPVLLTAIMGQDAETGARMASILELGVSRHIK